MFTGKAPLNPTEDRSYLIRDVSIVLMVLSTVFVLSRLYVRRFVSNSFGLDDYAAIIALVRSKQKPKKTYYRAG